MNNNNIKEHIEKLRKEVDLHNYYYHVLDNPVISDDAFDSLLKELISLEEKYPEYSDENSPTKRVGGIVLEKFKKVKHELPQMSFEKVFNFEELKKWEERNLRILEKTRTDTTPNFSTKNSAPPNLGGELEQLEYFCELKIDGLKVILKYENGKLIQAATRGDGEWGEDVTENIKTIKSIPLTLKEIQTEGGFPTIYVIGEVWMGKKTFEQINKERKNAGLELYANPRNTAAGTLRQLDTKVVAKRNLKYFAYDIQILDKNFDKYNTQEKINQTLKNFGFLVNDNSYLCKNLNEVEKIFKKWDGNKRYSFDYGIDGLVIKLNDKKITEFLGNTANAPRADVSYKFKTTEVTSIITDVIYQIGRTGVITPVAILEPVEIAGSIVRRATLHNFDEIKRLGIKIGDKVIVRKAGDIIPQVFKVLTNLRNGNEKEIQEIKKCPFCNNEIEKMGSKDGVKLICPNKNCKEKIKEKIVYYASRNCMNIDGLGEKIIEQFWNEGLIRNISDLYKLDYNKILTLDGWGEKSVENLKKAINDSKHPKLEKFIVSLGINTVGEETAIDLAKNFVKFENLFKSKLLIEEKLKTIYGIGDKTIFEIISFIKDENFQKELEEILKFVKPQDYIETKILNKLVDKKFVITGTFEKYSRPEIEKIIKENGGVVQAAINAKTNYLIAGKDAGSKLQKATELNIKTISLEEFENLIK